MELGIAGKNALVTGGSRGLGRQCAVSLAAEGVNVAICGRTQATLASAVAEIVGMGVSAVGIAADVSDAGDMARLHRETVERLGAVDILVNNAGGSAGATDIAETPLGNYRGVFDLNVFGGYELTRLCLPHMRGQNWGRVVNIASIWGREHGGNIGYMSAKAALIAATKHAGLSLAGTGITVNSIAPGSISHPGGSWERFQAEQPADVVERFIETQLPMGRFGWPEPVGDLCAFLASDRADLITGSCVVVDGGQSHAML